MTRFVTRITQVRRFFKQMIIIIHTCFEFFNLMTRASLIFLNDSIQWWNENQYNINIDNYKQIKHCYTVHEQWNACILLYRGSTQEHILSMTRYVTGKQGEGHQSGRQRSPSFLLLLLHRVLLEKLAAPIRFGQL